MLEILTTIFFALIAVFFLFSMFIGIGLTVAILRDFFS